MTDAVKKAAISKSEINKVIESYDKPYSNSSENGIAMAMQILAASTKGFN